MADPAEPVHGLAERPPRELPIPVVQEDLLSRIPAARDVVDNSFVLGSQWSDQGGEGCQIEFRIRSSDPHRCDFSLRGLLGLLRGPCGEWILKSIPRELNDIHRGSGLELRAARG